MSVKTRIVAYSVQLSGSEINTKGFEQNFEKSYNMNNIDHFLIISLNLFFQNFLINNGVNYYFLRQYWIFLNWDSLNARPNYHYKA